MTQVTPLLNVRRGLAALAFYEAALGAQTIFQVDDGQGHVVAQLSVDGAEFWLADESPEHQNHSPESLKGSSARMLLIVDNPDERFDRAVNAGASVVWPVSDQHGWRVGRVVDPFGHHWEIARKLA